MYFLNLLSIIAKTLRVDTEALFSESFKRILLNLAIIFGVEGVEGTSLLSQTPYYIINSTSLN